MCVHLQSYWDRGIFDVFVPAFLAHVGIMEIMLSNSLEVSMEGDLDVFVPAFLACFGVLEILWSPTACSWELENVCRCRSKQDNTLRGMSNAGSLVSSRRGNLHILGRSSALAGVANPFFLSCCLVVVYAQFSAATG